MSGIRTRSFNVKYTLKEMGYKETDSATQYVLKLHDIIMNSSANYRDRTIMLKILQHIIHKFVNKRRGG